MKYVKYSWESMNDVVAYHELHQKREETEGWERIERWINDNSRVKC